MILMQAPAPGITFSGMPSGATYVADPYGLIRISNNSTLDQAALEAAGCYTLSPFGSWGSFIFDTLADLYAADAASNLVLTGTVGFPAHCAVTVQADPDNNGVWYKTGIGSGDGNWSKSSATLSPDANAAIAAGAASTATASMDGAVAAAGTRNYLPTYPTALPYCVTGVSGGAGTGVGGTPGTYVLVASGGPQGFLVLGVVDSTGKVAASGTYTIVSGGISTSNVAPTLSWPAAAGFTTSPTAPTATVGVIPQGTYFSAPSQDGTQAQFWGNNSGTLATAPFGLAQLSMPLSSFISSIIKKIGPRYWNGAAVRTILDMDANERMSAFIDANGLLYAQLAAESSDDSISVGYNPITGKTTFTIPVVGGVKPIGGGAKFDTTARQLYYGGRPVVLADRDASGQGGATLLGDNAYRFGDAEFENGIGLDVGLETANYVFTTHLVNGKRQIRRHSKATGIATQITSLGNNAHPRLSLDGTAIVYATDRYTRAPEAIRWTTMYQPLDGGSEHPMISLPDIVCIGDSLTFGYGAYISYPSYLAQSCASGGIGIDNQGWGGQTTYQMAARIGAVQPTVTVSGNTISSGANTVTQMGGAALGTASTLGTLAADNRFLTHARADAVGAYGTLNGIYGTMLRTVDGSNNEVYTFTPDAAMTQTLPAACPANSPWQSINDWRDKTVIFYGGYNDRAFPAAVNANIDAIVSYLAPKVKRFMIFTVATGSTENLSSTGSGLTNYNNIVGTINPHIRSTYPNNYFDNWQYLIGGISGGTTTQALSDCGITPTSQDLTDIANQCVPTSLRADAVHMRDPAYRAVAQYGVYPMLVARGWHVR